MVMGARNPDWSAKSGKRSMLYSIVAVPCKILSRSLVIGGRSCVFQSVD